jgi:DNA-directed RNA polymerase specialized sigma24 family protein
MRKRKPLVLDEKDRTLMAAVTVVEEFLGEPLDTLTGDEEIFEQLSKVKNLPLEERRLFIVYTLMDCSVPKVARLFGVDSKTVSSRLNEIKAKITC